MMPEQDNADDVRAVFNDLVRTELADGSDGPPCECKCNGGEPHADRLCGRPATTFVALHRWGWCDKSPDAEGFTRPADVDADGNITSLMCGQCSDHAYQVAHRKIRMLIRKLPAGAIPSCPTCQRPTATADDILERRPM